MADDDSNGKKRGRGAKNKVKGKIASSDSQKSSDSSRSVSQKSLSRRVQNAKKEEGEAGSSSDLRPPPLMGPLPLMFEVKKMSGDSGAGTSSESGPSKPPKWKTPEESSDIAARHSEANKLQRDAYYFSGRPGTAVSADAFQESFQYSIHKFPLEKNVAISLDRKYSLMITPTSTRVNALFIRVKGQNDDQLATGALIDAEADEKTIREACRETIENYDLVKNSQDRFPFSICSEKFLTERRIVRLDDPILSFPDAIYYCEKCDYHISTITHAKSHLESSTHNDDVERQMQREQLLDKIPPPTKEHHQAVDNVLRQQLKKYEKIKKLAHERVDKALDYLKSKVLQRAGFPNAQLMPFGSSAYDVMLDSSDLNVAITDTLTEGMKVFEFLEKIRKQIVADEITASHSSDMGSTTLLQFPYERMQVNLIFLPNFVAHPSLAFTQLMKTYVSLRPEVVEFMQLVRMWATTAHLDAKNKSRIGMSLFGFDIMVVHYLQKVGMLPVLHELYEPEHTGDASDPSAPPPEVKTADGKVVPEEASRRRMRLMSLYPKDVEKIGEKFNLKKPWNLSKLWIDFFAYYTLGHREVVVQITQSELMKRDAHKWNKKILHVVDPFRGDNVLTIPKVSTWLPFYFNCLLKTYLSFAIPITKEGPIVDIGLYLNKTSSPKKRVKEAPMPAAPPPDATSVAPAQTPTILAESRKPFSVFRDEQADFNAKADAYAEEEEKRLYQKALRERLRFDGIPLSQLTPEDVDIDDHANQVYSSRAMRRFRRVLPWNMPEERIVELQEFGLCTKKCLKRLKKLRKRGSEEDVQLEKAATDAEKVDSVDQITEEVKNIGLVCSVMMVKTVEKSRRSEPPTRVEPSPENGVLYLTSRAPTPPVENSWMHWNTNFYEISSPKPPGEETGDDEKQVQNGVEQMKEQQKTSEDVVGQTEKKRGTILKKPQPSIDRVSNATAQSSEQTEKEEEKKTVTILKRPETPQEQMCNAKAQACTILNQKTPAFGKPPFESSLTQPSTQICTEEFFIRGSFNKSKVLSNARHLKCGEFRFSFDETAFCGGYEMEVRCTHCDGAHCIDSCPVMRVPPIEQFRPRTEQELRDIDVVIDRYYADNILREDRLKMIHDKVRELERRLQQVYRFDVHLSTFGSVMTGLSVNRSDIDICLRFGEGDEAPKDLEPREVIATTGDLLRKYQLAKRVQAITTAKVPIVKCQIKLANEELVDVDISYYNILALYNTLLLKEYSLWTPDNRFAKLALFVKDWAKNCDIGDASRGSLSSYAHVIMLIAYLQQCDPPVLPRLQEDFRAGSRNDRRFIENWDTTFVQGEPHLLETWQKNRDSCAQLLLGYFDYYAQFPYREFVAQCRQGSMLSKAEKDWPRPLCVEDPFDLSHNLSSGVSKKMFVFILKVFIGSRAAFMSSRAMHSRDLPAFPHLYKEQLYRACNQGTAPCDRQCHLCHRIGHFAEGCPLKGAANRRRNGATYSTNSSYRSNGGDRNGDGPDQLMYHKRTHYRRTNR